MGLEIRPPRQRVPGEGRSLYFYDDDNHLFELHTGTLAERLERYATREKCSRHGARHAHQGCLLPPRRQARARHGRRARHWVGCGIGIGRRPAPR